MRCIHEVKNEEIEFLAKSVILSCRSFLFSVSVARQFIVRLFQF